MQIVLKGTPYPKQVAFFKAKAKFIAYGGSRGGGKSWAARRKATLLALSQNLCGIQILFLRRKYNDVFENHIYPLMLELGEVASFNQKTKSFDFPWGSRIIFGYCDNERDVLQFQGKAYDAIFVEEATQFNTFMLQTLTESLRPSGMMKSYKDWSPRMYYTCNPGGEGHAYIKRLFIDRKFKSTEKAGDYLFIPSTVYENEFLMKTDPSYIEVLENLPEARKKAMLYGDWNVFSGQFFMEWRDVPENYYLRTNTHVIEPFTIPSTWKRFRVLDWGYAKPFSVGWYALDHDNVAYRYREWYGCTGEPDVGIRYTPQQVAEHIKAIESNYEPQGVYIEGVADPAIFHTDTGKSIAEAFEDCGVFFIPADNSRLTGWQQMRTRLQFDDAGYAMLYFFKTNHHATRTVPTMIHDKIKLEDMDTNLEDHISDEVRYFCMHRKVASRSLVTPSDFNDLHDPLNLNEKRPNYYGLGIYMNR